MAFRNWVVAGLAGAALSLTSGLALAQSYTPPAPVITVPQAGANVSSPVTVAFDPGNPGGGPGWSGGSPPTGSPPTGSPPAGSPPAGSPPTGEPRRHGQAFLVIDQSAPAAGDAIAADPQHLAFPAGQHQLSVSLAPGQHHLQIVFANRRGEVSSRIPASAPVTVTVN